MDYKSIIIRKKPLSLPWLMYNDIIFTPTEIITPSNNIIDPRRLDLLLWKSAFYDRGKMNQYRHLFPDSVEYK